MRLFGQPDVVWGVCAVPIYRLGRQSSGGFAGTREVLLAYIVLSKVYPNKEPFYVFAQGEGRMTA